MAAKKKNRPKQTYTEIYNSVLEGMAYAKLKPTEWQFIMALWRLTYGRKNMAHKESGKWTTWHNAEFHRRTGLNRAQISKIKVSLVKKKVIRRSKGMVGFQKDFSKWATGTMLSKPTILSKQTIVQTDNKVLSKQTTTVVQTDNIDGCKPMSSADLQSLKKERKKERYSCEVFGRFWRKYPKKIEKLQAWSTWVTYFIEGNEFNEATIMARLDHAIAEQWDGRETKFIPNASTWLNRRPWDDGEPVDACEFEIEQLRKDALAKRKEIENGYLRREYDLIERTRREKAVSDWFRGNAKVIKAKHAKQKGEQNEA